MLGHVKQIHMKVKRYTRIASYLYEINIIRIEICLRSYLYFYLRQSFAGNRFQYWNASHYDTSVAHFAKVTRYTKVLASYPSPFICIHGILFPSNDLIHSPKHTNLTPVSHKIFDIRLFFQSSFHTPRLLSSSLILSHTPYTGFTFNMRPCNLPS